MEVTSAPRILSLISSRVMNEDLNRTKREKEGGREEEGELGGRKRVSMVQETFDPRGTKDTRKGDGLS